jgi:hypothetical protein
LTPTKNGVLSNQTSQMLKPGTMLPDPAHPIFCITDSPPNVAGTTHLLSLIHDSYKHVALFFIAGHTLHEPHPLFQKFASICKPYGSNLRPVILARSFRIGGFRKPNWASDDILFLGTNTHLTEKTYGLNGKSEMGLLVIRPDGYIGYSTTVDLNGNAFDRMEAWLADTLVKSK